MSDDKYCVDGRELDFVQSYRDLGVVIDPSLKFHLHINCVVGKAGSLMGELLRGTVCRSREFMVALFVSHIRPLLDYCSCVWNVGYLADVRRLESVQRRWTREVGGVGHMEYGDRLKALGLFSISGRLLRADLIKMWRVMRGDLVEELTELLSVAPDSRARGHMYKLLVPACRTEMLRRYFGVRCVTVWNGLSSELVEAGTLDSFKRGLGESLGDLLYRVL